MRYPQWEVPVPDDSVAKSHADLVEAGLTPLLAAVLCARGIRNPEQARSFLYVQEQPLHDPYLMKDMDRAVARIRMALQRRETICVFGDYDVDGITSTCLLTDYLRRQGGRILQYIPDRLDEGYSLNAQAVSSLYEQGVTLIVTVDCGITAVNEVEQANELGIDVVVTDHHKCPDFLPPATAVVDPHRPDSDYPFPSLAGVGVTFKLVQALDPSDGEEDLLEEYVDLVAVGTIADVMDLTGENRILVQKGLAALSRTRRPGLRALLRQAGALEKPAASSTVSFTLAPRINAAGRMGSAGTALRLLQSADPAQAEQLASELEQLNQERKKIEGDIYQQCLSFLGPEKEAFTALVLADTDWHPGVIGIVASRLAEQYCCPVFLICLSEEPGKGSCRSYGGFDLFSALKDCSDLLENYGGHAQAAGFTISRENIDSFRARMEQAAEDYIGGAPVENVLTTDLCLPNASWLTLEQVKSLDQLEPCGAGNPSPILVLDGSEVVSVSPVGENGRHLKLRLRHQGIPLDAIFFSGGDLADSLRPGDLVRVAFTPQINEFRGKSSVQLRLYDLQKCSSPQQSQRRDLLSRLSEGGPFTSAEANIITPGRQEFVAVWRYLKSFHGPGPLETSPARLSEALSGSRPPEQAYGQSMVCIQVFHDLGLLRVENRTPDCLRIRFLPERGKVDLEQAALLQYLRRLSAE